MSSRNTKTTRSATTSTAQLQHPNMKCEFIAELSALISKWRGRAGKEADAYAGAYENVLCSLLTPEPETVE